MGGRRVWPTARILLVYGFIVGAGGTGVESREGAFEKAARSID